MAANAALRPRQIRARWASSSATSIEVAENPHGDARHDRERAFRSHDETDQIRSRRVGERALEAEELSVGHDRLDAEDVMRGEAVLQTVRAAGILRDVAADRAHLLARRIRRVVVTERRDLS